MATTAHPVLNERKPMQFDPKAILKESLSLAAFLPLCLILCGCGKSAVEKAFESDSNGFFCKACRTKFYTGAGIFADHCPQCRSANIQEVVGFVCPKDQHTTLAPRGQGAMACEQCGAITTALRLPHETDFQKWGAT